VKYFKGFYSLRVNIAQIIVVCMLIPVVALICNLFAPDNGGWAFGNFIFSLMDEIPMCNIWCGLLAQFIGGSGDLDLAGITIMVFLRAFPEAIMVGVLIHFFCELFNKEWNIFKKKEKIRNFHPLPIFPSFLGLFAATLLINLLDLMKSDLITLIVEICIVAIMITGLKMMFGTRYAGGIFSLKKILTLIIDGIYGIIAAGYMTVMLMGSSGLINGMSDLLPAILAVTGLMMVASLIVWWVHRESEKDDIV